MVRYNIYAGMGGGFGGARYAFTTECVNQNDAEQEAYDEAVSIYQSYEGCHGIRSEQDVINDYCEDNNISESDFTDDDYAETEAEYLEEVEGWLDYYAIPTDEDVLEENELDIL